MNDPIRLGLAWQTSASDNLGVSALAQSNLSIAVAAANRVGRGLEVIEFCSVKTAPISHEGVPISRGDSMSVKRMLTGKSRFREQLSSCHVILDIGEGDSFADIYGLKRLGLLCLSKWLALQSGVPLVLSPQTIGPFAGAGARIASNALLRRATKVFARDALSAAYLQAQKITKNVDVVTDVAFRLPFARQPGRSDGLVHVGINVSGLLYNGGYNQSNQFGLVVDYPKLVHELIAVLLARTATKVHLVGHVNSQTFGVEDDFRVCQALASEYPACQLAPRFEHPSAAKAYISSLDFFTGARMHACIGAFSSGVPVVPMAYSRKFNGLFNSLEYRHIADLKVHDNAAALRAVMEGFAARGQLAAEVAQGNQMAQQKLQRYEDYLADLFGRLRDEPH